MATRMRVEVWNGTGEEYLGKGYFVGLATVYVMRTPEGNLLSHSNAEDPPPPEVIDFAAKLDTEVEEIKHNPVIELDDGGTVYGCQVWWQPIPDEKGGNNANRKAPDHQDVSPPSAKA